MGKAGDIAPPGGEGVSKSQWCRLARLRDRQLRTASADWRDRGRSRASANVRHIRKAIESAGFLAGMDALLLLHLARRGNMRPMARQLQQHGNRQPWRSTLTTHRRCPSCRRSDSRFVADRTNRRPISERSGLNLYGFVENAPVKKTDRLGRETIGAAYQTDGALGHAALEVGGKGYGFGPEELRPFFTIGTTSGFEPTATPRTVWDLSIRKTGKFKDKRGGTCCNATVERIIQCADHFKTIGEGTPYRGFRNCRHYVNTITSSCCLSRGSSRHEPEVGGAQ